MSTTQAQRLGAWMATATLMLGWVRCNARLGVTPSIIVVNLIPVLAASSFMLRLLPVFTKGRRRASIRFDEHHAYRARGSGCFCKPHAVRRGFIAGGQGQVLEVFVRQRVQRHVLDFRWDASLFLQPGCASHHRAICVP